MRLFRVIVLAIISVSAAAQMTPRSVTYFGPIPRATLAYSWRVPSLYQIATVGVTGFWTLNAPTRRPMTITAGLRSRPTR